MGKRGVGWGWVKEIIVLRSMPGVLWIEEFVQRQKTRP